MPRPTLLRAALAASLLALAACGDSSRDPSPLAPSPAPRLALSTTAACLRTDATYLSQQIGTLTSDSRLRQTARGYESAVESECRSATPEPYPASTVALSDATAPGAALAYAEWLLARRGTPGFSATDAFLWTYMTRLFAYVGYAIPKEGTGFGPGGFVRICYSGTPCQVESPDGRLGVRIPSGALSATPGLRFLVTAEPRACDAFENFSAYSVYSDDCVDVTVDPKPNPSFTLQAPGTLVEMCTTKPEPATPHYVTERRVDVYSGLTTTQGKLGQRSPRAGGAFSPISFRPYATGFLDDYWCDHEKPLPAPSAAARVLRTAGDALLALFTPGVAYAGHGGLGTLPGFVEEFSVFGPLDGYAFNGDFEHDGIGTFPATSAEMRGGSWTLATGPNPSRASVRPPSGQFASQYLELDQGGGNATSKLGLTFSGLLAHPMTTAKGDADRRVRLRFRAAVMSPRALDAVVEARTSGGGTLATFVFRDGKSGQSGTVDVEVPNGTQKTALPRWTQGVVQNYQITISFTADPLVGVATSALVQIGLVGQPPIASYTRTSPTPLDLAGVRWVLLGRDGQLLASDDYQFFDAPAGVP